MIIGFVDVTVKTILISNVLFKPPITPCLFNYINYIINILLCNFFLLLLFFRFLFNVGALMMAFSDSCMEYYILYLL